MGGFEGGLRFDDAAGGACKSVCITVIVVLRYPARVVGLGHPMLVSTSPFFNSTSGPLFDLLCPLTDLLFGLVPRCGRFVCHSINDWRGGRFGGYGGHWDIDEWWGVRDGCRNLWSDVQAHVGLVIADGGVINRSITLGFENGVVELGSAAFGIISLVNVGVMGLGGVGSSLGMAGALLDG